MDLCRRVIRQNISRERIDKGRIAELSLPRTIKDYLEYKDRKTVAASASAASAAAAAASTASAAAAAAATAAS